METQPRENGLADTVGEGQSGTNWESSKETYKLPYVKQVPSGNLLGDPGSSNRVLNLEDERGWEVGGRGHMYTYG